MDGSTAAGMKKQAWITRVKGKQADQAENHQKEKEDADNLFFHCSQMAASVMGKLSALGFALWHEWPAKGAKLPLEKAE
jgi:hypothetical protein